MVFPNLQWNYGGLYGYLSYPQKNCHASGGFDLETERPLTSIQKVEVEKLQEMTNIQTTTKYVGFPTLVLVEQKYLPITKLHYFMYNFA